MARRPAVRREIVGWASPPRQTRVAATTVNERWAMDFVSDAVAGGQKLRVLTLLDTYARECVALEVGGAISAAADTLSRTKTGCSF
jgi:putative transposase